VDAPAPLTTAQTAALEPPEAKIEIHFNERDEQMKSIFSFLRDEQGQDLIEYTLLLAFVALASAALFIGAGGSVQGIWSVTNSQLLAANTSAS
jgi:Flp pilus assembly pilin Flp